MAKSPTTAKESTPARKITEEMADRLYEYYLEKPTATYVSRQGGVNRHTATRLIHRGYPRRGIVAFRDRATALKKRASKMTQAATDLVERESVVTLAQIITKARAYLADWDEILVLTKLRLREELSQDDVPAGFLARAVKDLGDANKKHLECLAMLSGLENPTAAKSARDEAFDGWTDAEYEAFQGRGIWPKRIPIPAWWEDIPPVKRVDDEEPPALPESKGSRLH